MNHNAKGQFVKSTRLPSIMVSIGFLACCLAFFYCPNRHYVEMMPPIKRKPFVVTLEARLMRIILIIGIVVLFVLAVWAKK